MTASIKCLLLLVFSVLFGSWNAVAQDDVAPTYPKIGKLCPDFSLNPLHYKRDSVSLSDLKGTFVVLDFWDRWCTACVNSFPDLELLKKKFENRVNFFLVGADDTKNGNKIRTLYERLREKYHLTLPVAYSDWDADASLWKRFGIFSLPTVILINPRGIIVAITDHLNEAAMRDFVENKQLHLAVRKNVWEQERMESMYDRKLPLLINGNGGPDTGFIFRSLFTRHKEPIPYSSSILTDHETRFEVLGVELAKLYRLAYFGRQFITPGDSLYGICSNKLFLKLDDSSAFQVNYSEGNNVFCYSLMVPKERARASVLQKIMRNDLNNYFGYSVVVRNKIMPYWALTAKASRAESLLTKGGAPMIQGDGITNIVLINQPISTLIHIIWGEHQDEYFSNQTGIRGNIDISLQCMFNDLEEVTKALRKAGLELKIQQKDMRVIEIGKTEPGV